MSKTQPFQGLASATGSVPFLFASCGSKVVSILKNGQIAATWAAEREETSKSAGDKRKLEDLVQDSPLVLSVTVAPTSPHLCIVTEDKYIRVLEINEEGGLTQLSQRSMPKRTCAIAITEDSKTIICGDKFGDCYALPLLPVASEDATATPSNGAPKVWTPAATELTVHTQRNRKALEEQLRAKSRKNNVKEPLAFEHKLLLGHVSMLTDMKLAKDPTNGANYIITCDRDEHIRVSRGMPQTHIIESFCMGHTEFIHKLLVIPGTTTLLSAGGDNWMGVWDWKTSKLLAKHDLGQLRPSSDGATDDSESRIAVQNIWSLHGPDGEAVVAVKAEGSSALAIFNPEGIEDVENTAQIVDAAHVGDIIDLVEVDGLLIVSIDGPTRLHALRLEKVDGKWSLIVDEEGAKRLSTINGVEVVRSEGLDQVLHNAERLRKSTFEEHE